MAPSIVQHIEQLTFPSSGNPSFSVSTPVTKGNLLVIQVQTTSNTGIVPDDGRNVWVPVPSTPDGGAGGFIQTFWAVAESTRALTINILGVTATTTGLYYQATLSTMANAGAQFVELTGTSITGHIYGAVNALATTTTPNINVTITTAGDMIMAFCFPTSPNTVTETAGTTNIAGPGTSRSGIYKFAAGTGSTNIAFSQSANSPAVIVAFAIGSAFASHTISGALGAAGAGATVSFISQTSGFVVTTTANASGNYSLSLETDFWIVQPQLVGVGFTPNAQTGVHNTVTTTENFTSVALPTNLVFTPVATDTMHRANENPLSDGGNWTLNGLPVPPWDAQLKIVSNEAVASVTTVEANYAGPYSGDAVSVWVGPYIPAQQYMTFQVDALNSAPTSHACFGVLLRASLNGVSDYFYTGVPNGDGTITLGLYSLLGPVYPIQPTNLLAMGLSFQRYMYWKAVVTFTPGDTFTLACINNVNYMYHNGVLIGTFLDQTTLNLVQGTPILYIQAQAQNDCQISNVVMGKALAPNLPVTDIVNFGNNSATALTSNAAPPFPVVAGDLVVAFCRYFDNSSQTITGCSDTTGVNYTQRAFTTTNQTGLACYSAIVPTTNANNVVTFHFSAGVEFSDVTVYHIPGGGAFDNATTATAGTTVTSLSGTISTNNPNELVIGYCSTFGSNNNNSLVDFNLTMNRPGGTPLNGGYCGSGWQTYATPQTNLSLTATFNNQRIAQLLKGDMILAAFTYTPFVPSVGPQGSTIYPGAGGTNPSGANIYPNVSPLIYP